MRRRQEEEEQEEEEEEEERGERERERGVKKQRHTGGGLAGKGKEEDKLALNDPFAPLYSLLFIRQPKLKLLV